MSSSSSIIILRVKCRSAKRCTEQNSDKTEKIRPPSFKNLVDFLSLSLSFDGDDSDKLILKLGRRASFTLLSIFCLRRRTLLLLCVCSLFLSKMMMMMMMMRAGSKKERVYYAAKIRKKREKREKKREKQDLKIGQSAHS